MQIRFDGTRWLPGWLTLRQYQIGWLPNDIVAGLVLSTMLVPVGMAYAVASGLPGIYGLYATIIPLLAYAVFGPSRLLVLGPDSSLAAVILGVVLPLSVGDPQRAVALAGMMAIVSGIVCILAGVGRLGFITELLSKPIRYGYMNGIALTVLISQLPKVFGFSIDIEGPLRGLWAITDAIAAGRTNWVALAIGVGSLVVILLLKRSLRIPGILIAVVGATAVVGAFDLAARAGLSVLGPLPQGLPGLTIPLISPNDVVPVLIGGLAVASSPLPIPACFPAPMLPEPAGTSIPIRKWWASGPPIWPPGSFRVFRSAAVRRERRLRRLRERKLS